MIYTACEDRYKNMKYNPCGNSGLKLPAVSLGLWHNFGADDDFSNSRSMIRKAFDLGITHFDLANNYGPPAGSAEETFGRILTKDLGSYRDEIIISTKAGYGMWQGPYGDGGSRKYMISSLDQSLKRLGVDYVDIFYHHRPDPQTPIEETMGALDSIVRQGKALYVGISNYSPQETKKALSVLKDLGTPCVIHQFSYSMLNRCIEYDGLLDLLEGEGVGSIAFCPLSQGMLTNKYLKGIPTDSRAGGSSDFLKTEDITEEKLDKIRRLNDMALSRNQSLAQMALSWVLRKERLSSVLIGASRVSQIEENVKSIENLDFSDFELKMIDEILRG
jgi:L-glyceraldehyde 3-phosphate reductase